jgi:hypothetical protein
MFTPDWFRPRPYRRGQDRAVVESQQGRRAAPHVYPCADRPQALLSRKAIGLGGKVGGGDIWSRRGRGAMHA